MGSDALANHDRAEVIQEKRLYPASSQLKAHFAIGPIDTMQWKFLS